LVSPELPLSSPCEVSISIVSDNEIKKLNAFYRRKNKPTDVLSFSMIEGLELPFSSPALGDVVISIDTATRQAKEYKVNLYQELLRLLIHGLLHLLGYDHEHVSKAAAKRMKTLEETLYEKYLFSAKNLI